MFPVSFGSEPGGPSHESEPDQPAGRFRATAATASYAQDRHRRADTDSYNEVQKELNEFSQFVENYQLEVLP